nr:MAG TPA: hypothetical protein [Caudoviricetes sp.]
MLVILELSPTRGGYTYCLVHDKRARLPVPRRRKRSVRKKRISSL